MNKSVFFEMEFIFLLVFSVVVPLAIYAFLFIKLSISRWTVGLFGLLLEVVSGIDVTLLRGLSEKASRTGSLLDDKLFIGQVSLALYLVPAILAGLGLSLLSHLLINHINDAEKRFDIEHRKDRNHDAPNRRYDKVLLVSAAVFCSLVFFLDIATGAEIRLHVLYLFPLAMVARTSVGVAENMVALFITTLAQIYTFSNQAIAIPSFITDICVAFAASLLVVYLARTSRQTLPSNFKSLPVLNSEPSGAVDLA